MPYRPHGRAQVNPSNPRAWATCDQCGFIGNLENLSWQFQWTGTVLENQKFLVCDRCLDTPAKFLQTIILPPDPVPVANPRPENYARDFNNVMAAEEDVAIVTQDETTFLIPDNSVNDADEDAP